MSKIFWDVEIDKIVLSKTKQKIKANLKKIISLEITVIHAACTRYIIIAHNFELVVRMCCILCVQLFINREMTEQNRKTTKLCFENERKRRQKQRKRKKEKKYD